MKKIVYLLFLVTSLAFSQDIKWDPSRSQKQSCSHFPTNYIGPLINQ
jgi:hypothetical protein